MFFTKKKVATVILAFVLLFSIVSPASRMTANAAQKENHGLSETQVAFVKKCWPIVHELCEKSLTKDGLGDSDYVLLAQVALESFYFKSDISRDKNNDLGIDAYETETQSIYEHARRFDSHEECYAYHVDLMIRKYKTAARHHDDPFTFVKLIAESYAPGSDEYVDSITELIKKFARYNVQYYREKIWEVKKPLNRAKRILAETKARFAERTKELMALDRIRVDELCKACKTKQSKKPLGLNSPIDPDEVNYGKSIRNLRRNIKRWKKDLRRVKKDAHTTFRTLRLASRRA
ncbi:glucosaminidase domain-containing protein [Candidatus Saccharibacteria bacterium]|nr:glucosaminidase domain-containing protein [Candidatus Saccharibacteria bacterium]